MTNMFMGNALWHLIKQSDAVCKGVLILLLVLSIISWALFFYKWLLLSKKRTELMQAISALNNAKTIQDLQSIGFRFSLNAGGVLLNRVMAFYTALQDTADIKKQVVLDTEEREMLKEHAYQLIDETIEQQESSLPFLSATAAISPLLGLFGTVWGLVHAFVGISEKQTADIATVAPGIAEALITTLAGLMVAIPALAMFVYLNTVVKNVEQRCMNIVDRCLLIIQRSAHS